MRTVAVVLACLLAGCFSAATFNATSLGTLKTRAAFDLGCKDDQLAFVPLAYGDGVRYFKDVVEQYGVTGCGQRVTYVLVGGNWVANATSRK